MTLEVTIHPGPLPELVLAKLINNIWFCVHDNTGETLKK